MTGVGNRSFPILFKKLWRFISADNLIGGSRGLGLWPFNSSAVSLGKCLNPEEDVTIPLYTGNPSRFLREVIVNAIAPTPSPETLTVLENSRKTNTCPEFTSFDFQRSGRLSAAGAKGEGC